MCAHERWSHLEGQQTCADGHLSGGLIGHGGLKADDKKEAPGNQGFSVRAARAARGHAVAAPPRKVMNSRRCEGTRSKDHATYRGPSH